MLCSTSISGIRFGNSCVRNSVVAPAQDYAELYKNAFVAQSVEHLPFKQRVVGSIPTGRT